MQIVINIEDKTKGGVEIFEVRPRYSTRFNNLIGFLSQQKLPDNRLVIIEHGMLGNSLSAVLKSPAHDLVFIP